MSKILLFLPFLLLGCTTPTLHIRRIEIHKDSNGEVVKILEVEEMVQQVDNSPAPFKYLK